MAPNPSNLKPLPQPVPQAVPQPMPELESSIAEHRSDSAAGASKKARKGIFAGLASMIAAGIIATTFLLAPAEKTDDLTEEQWQQRTEQFQAATAAGVPVRAVLLNDPAEVKEAVATLKLDKQAETNLLNDLLKHGMSLVWLEVYDNVAVDGDVVAVDIAGFRRIVPITHKPESFVVPVPPGTNAVQFTGVHDGGGGITLGMNNAAGPVPFPRLRVGQTISVPVIVK